MPWQERRGDPAVPPEQMQAEIENLRLWQEAQKKHWLRWGLASNAVSLVLCAVVLLKVALTGNDPPPPMIFIQLMLIFMGLAFMTAGRPFVPARRQQR
jgi:hypothetical protein